ncbi:hypothetical protein ATI61_106242 [Archangium gephyra]|uniref:DUF7847 domain-containing protein n=1 Tax=Archangium gephyra TaxID=48 RepID=A0ABX9K0F9_9BACT|nr:hypothetical protein [Archangium gephyra]REG30772.1 hypothetical protein ATI61_106242 [Archangium gephyra]
MQSLSAACAIHPDLGAVFTCERCGTFGCEDCRGSSQALLCQACVQRVAPTVVLSAGELLQDSFSLLSRNLSGVGLLLAGSLAGSVLSAAFLPSFLQDPAPSGFLLGLVSACLSSFVTAVFLSWTAQNLLQQPEPSLLSALQVGLVRFVSLFLMSILFGIAVAAGMLCFILPGLYLAVRMSLAPALVVLDGRGPLEALNHSYQLTEGHRLTLFVVFAVMILLQLVLALAGQLVLGLVSSLGAPSWLGMELFLPLWQVLGSALLYGAVVLAWMRITGRVPAQA